MNRLFLFAILILVLVSCFDKPLAPADNHDIACSESTQPSIVGMWETNWMIVDIDSINNSETDMTIRVSPSDWKDKVNTLPSRCRFNDDGTYVSWIYDTGNKLVRKCIGHWIMNGERLTLEQEFPSVKNMTWQVNAPKCTKFAELFSKYDFDGDGKIDDQIYYQMKRISPACI